MTEDIAEDDLEEVVANVALCSECDEYAEPVSYTHLRAHET